MAELTPTTSAVFIPEIWSKEVQMFAEENLALASRVKRFDSDAKNGGDTIHIPKLTSIAAGAKSNDTDLTFTANTESEISLSINKHYYAAFKLADITRVQSSYNLRSLYTSKLGYSLAEQIDTDLGGLYSGLSQTVGTTNTALTDAVFLSGIQKLDEANAPMSDRHFVFKPSVKKDVLSLDKFVLFQNRNKETVNTGEIGELYGVEMVVSTNIVTSASSPNPRNNNLLFHREAFALAMQMEPRIEAQYMVRALAWEVAAQVLYGVVEYRDGFGVTVYS